MFFISRLNVIAGASVCFMSTGWVDDVAQCFIIYVNRSVVSVAGASVCILWHQFGWLVLLVHLSVCFMSTGRVVSVTGASVCVLYVNRSDG